jgi:hypothetical protein
LGLAAVERVSTGFRDSMREAFFGEVPKEFAVRTQKPRAAKL